MPMTSGTSGPQNYRRAEQLADEAYKRLGRGEEESAAAWAAVAAVYAQLAGTAAEMAGHLPLTLAAQDGWEDVLSGERRQPIRGEVEPEAGG